MVAADWTVVVASRTGSSSVHYCDDLEATRLADATKADGGCVLDGPRALTDWELLTGSRARSATTCAAAARRRREAPGGVSQHRSTHRSARGVRRDGPARDGVLATVGAVADDDRRVGEILAELSASTGRDERRVCPILDAGGKRIRVFDGRLLWPDYRRLSGHATLRFHREYQAWAIERRSGTRRWVEVRRACFVLRPYFHGLVLRYDSMFKVQGRNLGRDDLLRGFGICGVWPLADVPAWRDNDLPPRLAKPALLPFDSDHDGVPEGCGGR